MAKSKSTKELSESSSRKRKAGAVASPQSSKADEVAVHEDAMAILSAVVEFRSKNNGRIPTPSIMEPLFRSLKDSLREKLTSVDQLYSKFRSLKRKYRRVCEGPTPTDRAFYDLSVKAWGGEEEEEKLKKGEEDKKKKKKAKKEKEKEKDKEKEKEKERTAAPMDVDDDGVDEAEEEKEVEDDDNDGDGSNFFKHLAARASKFWPQMGLPTEILELGLQSIDQKKAAVLEKKWSAFLEIELKNMTRLNELNREVYTALLGGLKSKRSS